MPFSNCGENQHFILQFTPKIISILESIFIIKPWYQPDAASMWNLDFLERNYHFFPKLSKYEYPLILVGITCYLTKIMDVQNTVIRHHEMMSQKPLEKKRTGRLNKLSFQTILTNLLNNFHFLFVFFFVQSFWNLLFTFAIHHC